MLDSAILAATLTLSPSRSHSRAASTAVDWGVSLTHFYLAEDVARKAPAVGAGLVALPTGPGLGIDVDETAVERYRIR
jgi:muconate cycloisomerase